MTSQKNLIQALDSILKETQIISHFCSGKRDYAPRIRRLKQRISALEEALLWAKNAKQPSEVFKRLKAHDSLLIEQVVERLSI